MASTKNYIAGAAQSLIFGFSFMFTKSALKPLGALDSYELLFLRFLAAALLMTGLAALGVIKVDFRGKRLAPLALTAVLQPVLYFIAETEGVKLIATSSTGIILSAIPIVVALLAAVFLKEKMSVPQALMMLLSFAGVLLVTFFRAGADLGGSVLGFALIGVAMVLAAFYNIASRKASATFTPAETTFFMMWFGTIAFGLIFGGTTAAKGSFDLFARMDAQAWWSVAYLGVLSSVVAFFCVNYNLSKLQAPEAAVFANLTTVVSVVAGVFLLGEPISLWDIAGGILIIAGIWGTNSLKKPTAAVVAEAETH